MGCDQREQPRTVPIVIASLRFASHGTQAERRKFTLRHIATVGRNQMSDIRHRDTEKQRKHVRKILISFLSVPQRLCVNTRRCCSRYPIQ